MTLTFEVQAWVLCVNKLPHSIEALCKILLNFTKWFVRNRSHKIWLLADRQTDRHSDSYIHPKNFVCGGIIILTDLLFVGKKGMKN